MIPPQNKEIGKCNQGKKDENKERINPSLNMKLEYI